MTFRVFGRNAPLSLHFQPLSVITDHRHLPGPAAGKDPVVPQKANPQHGIVVIAAQHPLFTGREIYVAQIAAAAVVDQDLDVQAAAAGHVRIAVVIAVFGPRVCSFPFFICFFVPNRRFIIRLLDRPSLRRGSEKPPVKVIHRVTQVIHKGIDHISAHCQSVKKPLFLQFLLRDRNEPGSGHIRMEKNDAFPVHVIPFFLVQRSPAVRGGGQLVIQPAEHRKARDLTYRPCAEQLSPLRMLFQPVFHSSCFGHGHKALDPAALLVDRDCPVQVALFPALSKLPRQKTDLPLFPDARLRSHNARYPPHRRLRIRFPFRKRQEEPLGRVIVRNDQDLLFLLIPYGDGLTGCIYACGIEAFP